MQLRNQELRGPQRDREQENSLIKPVANNIRVFVV